jgi:tetratricopeptide (TPR) repeat protein
MVTGQRLALAAILAAVGLALYLPSLHYPLIFDDVSSLTENPTIRNLWHVDVLRAPQDSPLAGRPVANVSFALNYACGGLEPAGYRLVNILLHVANALLVLTLVAGCLGLPRAPATLREHAFAAAWCLALLWIVHPLHTEAVVYLTQRTELLASFFWLLTVALSVAGWRSARPGRWFVLASLACGLGMLSKEMMAAAPLSVLLLDRALVSGTFAAALRRHAGLYAGLACSWLLLGAMLLTSPRSASAGFHLGVGPITNLLTQSQVLVHYLRLVFWPDDLSLAHDWPMVQHYREALASMLTMSALFAGMLWLLWRRPTAGALAAVFFLVLAPSSSFMPILSEVAAERRMYLPLISVLGLLLLPAAAVLVRRVRSPWPMAAAVVLLAGALASASAQRVRVYQSTLSIWSDAVAKRPASQHAHYGLAMSYVELGRHEQALAHFQQAVQLAPSPELWCNIAMMQLELKRPDEALRALEQAQAMDIKYPAAHSQIALLLTKVGQWDQAQRQYRLALERMPGHALTHNNFGAMLRQQGRVEEAIEQFQRAAAADPGRALYRFNLGLALRDANRLPEARAAFEQALKLSGPDAATHFQLASLLAQAGDLPGAAAQYQRVLALDPRHAQAHNNLGAVLARQGRLAEAVGHFEQAVELDPQYEAAADNLRRARARVEQGQGPR